MSDLGPISMEGWMSQVARRLFRLETRAPGPAMPQPVSTDQRPDPALTRVGTALFDVTLNRPIWVNATQTGYVDATGSAV